MRQAESVNASIFCRGGLRAPFAAGGMTRSCAYFSSGDRTAHAAIHSMYTWIALIVTTVKCHARPF